MRRTLSTVGGAVTADGVGSGDTTAERPLLEVIVPANALKMGEFTAEFVDGNVRDAPGGFLLDCSSDRPVLVELGTGEPAGDPRDDGRELSTGRPASGRLGPASSAVDPKLSAPAAMTLVSSAGASGIEGFSYSVVDEIEVPEDLEAGDYLLSWRWDAEQSPQIWQNCADITLVPPQVAI